MRRCKYGAGDGGSRRSYTMACDCPKWGSYVRPPRSRILLPARRCETETLLVTSSAVYCLLLTTCMGKLEQTAPLLFPSLVQISLHSSSAHPCYHLQFRFWFPLKTHTLTHLSYHITNTGNKHVRELLDQQGVCRRLLVRFGPRIMNFIRFE